MLCMFIMSGRAVLGWGFQTLGGLKASEDKSWWLHGLGVGNAFAGIHYKW